METKKLDDDSYVRRLIGFTCFAITSFPSLSKKPAKIWDFENVRRAFSLWINISESNEGRNREIIKISEAIENIEPGNDDFVFYKVDKNRFAGIVILYSIQGYYKSKEKKDKHGDLIVKLMKGISEGIFPDQEILDEINLTYYWNREVMRYLAKVIELNNMSDEIFKKLPSQDEWLNTKNNL